MNLNDTNRFSQLDPQNMIGHINSLPDQLAQAWQLGQSFDLPKWKGIRQIIVAGMGGSAIGADLVRAYTQGQLSSPLSIHRDYGLPAWVQGEHTLLLCSSHSGNTEESLSAFEEARKRNCRIISITTGGELAALTEKSKLPLWRFEHEGQPRTAVGYSFGLLLALLARLEMLPDPAQEVSDAVAAMKKQQENFLPEIPDIHNPSKRMGGQFMGRWITIYGAGHMAPVARRWKTQINENAKAQATFEILPEADHNTIQGVMQPEEEFGATMNIFLRTKHNHPRNKLRAKLTRMAIMLQGQNTDSVIGKSDSRLANMWTVLHYGDYASYYLAMAYGVDPTPVPMLVELKEELSAA